MSQGACLDQEDLVLGPGSGQFCHVVWPWAGPFPSLSLFHRVSDLGWKMAESGRLTQKYVLRDSGWLAWGEVVLPQELWGGSAGRPTVLPHALHLSVSHLSKHGSGSLRGGFGKTPMCAGLRP